MRTVVVVSGLLIAGVLLAGTFLPVRQRFIPVLCLDCGLVRQDSGLFGLRSSAFEPQPLTTWYDMRIGKPHAHRWMQYYTGASGSTNLWGKRVKMGSGSCRSGIWHDYLMSAIALRRLGPPINLDLVVYKELTHHDQVRRNNAISLNWHITGGSDDEVRNSWIKALFYLNEPGAWPKRTVTSGGGSYFVEGYDGYLIPPLRALFRGLSQIEDASPRSE